MISDLAILVALIISSLLLAMMAYSSQKIRLFVRDDANGGQDARSIKGLNRIQLYIQVIYFFLILAIIARLTYLFVFPAEYTRIQPELTLLSLPVGLLTGQFVYFAAYALLFITLLISQNLIPQKRQIFLLKVLKIGLFILVSDIVISFILYARLNMQSLLPGKLWEGRIANPGIEFLNISGLIVLGLLVVYVVIFFLRRKSARRVMTITYNILFVLNLLAAITALILGLFFVADQTPGLTLFTIKGGFAAQVWMLLLAVSIGSHWLSVIVSKRNNDFMNSNYGTNLTLQLQKITLTCVIALDLLAVWIPLMRLIYS